MSDRLTAVELLALPAVIDLATAARAMGIGRTKAYALAQNGEFPCTVVRIGNRYRIRTADVLRWLHIDTSAEPRRQRGAADAA